jgi:hypothetical protein
VETLIIALVSSPLLVTGLDRLCDWIAKWRARRIGIVIRDGDRSLEIASATASDNQTAIEEFFRND